MNKCLSLISLVAAFLLGSSEWVQAKENVGQKVRREVTEHHNRMEGGCDPASAFVDLDVNNVRARIMNGGDMWWDLVSTAKYEIPKVTEANQVRRTSLFAGALWIGGLENNNLKLAAMTYRQSGSDFFPGPLDTTTATIDPASCKQWDKIWEITQLEIDKFKEDPTQITQAIRDWPAHGNTALGQSRYLAPFKDVDGDGVYNPDAGDYPLIYGDQALWYVYNDVGNIHSETKASPIGLELQTMAFAYSSNDEINNMTFYTTTVTNRSKNRLDSTYFGEWVDADLGYAFDDYVGVDTTRSLGICYNGDNNDEGVTGYGANPPSVGVDFFQGPTDAKGKQLGMSYFVYYNNDFSNIGNPSEAIHYYYYLTGRWKNGDCIKNGGDGTKGAQCAKYMFPGDPENASQWSEVTAGNKPGDRRFLQSSGPFSLKPGAKNKVTVGVVWARATTGGATGSLKLLKLADDKAQKLYNNNFKLISGPPAPHANIVELDRKIVINLEDNTKKIEDYYDSIINENHKYIKYRFEGYKIYQLAASNVSGQELSNPDKARLIAQVDVKNGITKVVDRVYDPELGAYQSVLEVNGADQGLQHSFVVTQDAFASGDAQLVNYKFYYYMVQAYAVAEDPNENTQYLAGTKTYNSSSLLTYTAVPHKNASELGGTQLNADYGSGPEIIRMDGTGNGGNILELTSETENGIMSGDTNFIYHPHYVGGMGPVQVKVVDPTRVVPGTYEIRFTDAKASKDSLRANYAGWYVYNVDTHDTIYSDKTIGAGDEQMLITTKHINGTTETNHWGLSITARQNYSLGYPDQDVTNGLLDAEIVYNNPSQRWLDGVHDIEHNTNYGDKTPTPGNWIRAGRYGNADPQSYYPAVEDAAVSSGGGGGTTKLNWVDPVQVYEGMLGGIIAPAALSARSDQGTAGSLTMGPFPKFNNVSTYNFPKLSDLNSVDIILTPDKSKWSRCMVWEMGESAGLNEGGAAKFDLRAHDGWNGEVDAQGNPVYSSSPNDRGMSYFPGYAINLETGDRLNIFFGEDSHLPEENGADMIWNPTSNNQNVAAGGLDYLGRYIWGGKHWVYVMNSVGGASGGKYAVAYDGCQTYANLFKTNASQTNKYLYFTTMLYIMEPLLAPDYKWASLKDGLIPNEARIKIRVSKPYALNTRPGNGQNGGLPYYRFSTDGIAAVHNASYGKDAMPSVNVVPNPYYANSEYETSQLDNRVRITNLPLKCDISIYTLDGTLVRRIKRDEISNGAVALSSDGKYPSTYLDWDLKNQKGVPIASGVYIIHINGYDLGEKVIKWFGIMRPIDLDTF